MRLGSLLLMSIAIMILGSSSFAEESLLPTKLTGFQETPPILTSGSGILRMKFDRISNSIDYTLTFEGLSSPVTVAHIHFGHRGGTGAPVVFLCGGGGKPACPNASAGTITGTLLAADVLAVSAQGIHAGNFSDLIALLKTDKTYVNVHTTTYPTGEIRGQI